MSDSDQSLRAFGWSFSRSGFANLSALGISLKDDDGEEQLQDTPELWAMFVARVARHALDERAGKRPFRRSGDWDDFWETWISVLLDGHQENADRYVRYIVQYRRRQGLEELKPEVVALIG